MAFLKAWYRDLLYGQGNRDLLGCIYTGKWDLMMHANLVITNTNVNSHKNSLELVSVCAGKGAVVVDEHEDTNEKNRCCTLNF